MSEPTPEVIAETPLAPEMSDPGGEAIQTPPSLNSETPSPEVPAAPVPPGSQPKEEPGVVDWRQSLPEGIRDHEKLKSFTSPEQAAQALIDAKELPEIPNAENYTFKNGGGVSPEFGELLNKKGFTQEQVDSMVEMRSGLDVVERKTRVTEYAGQLKDVFTEWGEDSEKNKNLAASALKQFDPEGEIAEVLKVSGEAFNPKVVKFFHRLGASLSEHQLLRSTTPAQTQNKSLGDLFFPSMADNKEN